MTTWKDYPDTSTPITAAALNDLESRADLALSTATSATENLNATTENLTTRVSTLESRVSTLESRVSTLEARPTVQAGRIGGVAALSAGGTWTQDRTFPKAFPAGTIPAVLVTPGDARLTVSVSNVTNTGFTVGIRNDSGGNVVSATFGNWAAIA